MILYISIIFGDLPLFPISVIFWGHTQPHASITSWPGRTDFQTNLRTETITTFFSIIVILSRTFEMCYRKFLSSKSVEWWSLESRMHLDPISSLLNKCLLSQQQREKPGKKSRYWCFVFRNSFASITDAGWLSEFCNTNKDLDCITSHLV